MATLAWNTVAADVTTVIKILVNQIVVETITLTGLVGTDSSLTTVLALGDEVALEEDAGTLSAQSNFTLFVD